MDKGKLEVADVQIERHRIALLTPPDPAIANKTWMRVPIGEGVGYSAADWTNAWRAGSIDFVDSYYLAHGKQPSKEIVDKLQTYIYVNKLDPMFPSSWTVEHERLQAACVIKLEFA